MAGLNLATIYCMKSVPGEAAGRQSLVNLAKNCIKALLKLAVHVYLKYTEGHMHVVVVLPQ